MKKCRKVIATQNGQNTEDASTKKRKDKLIFTFRSAHNYNQILLSKLQLTLDVCS